uniref:Uncharacterized protein n=1 Tax=Arundo donax TaxID=35708 RepID=A0A0A8YPH3_ARUDO
MTPSLVGPSYDSLTAKIKLNMLQNLT